LTRCFIAWTEALREASGGEIVSIDGKTLRHSFEPATGPGTIPMVRAWASAHRLVLGQLKGEEKSNDITALPPRLTLLDIAGAIVTSDAMGCQKEMAKVMTDQEADDVLALKENQPTLSEEVTQLFDEAKATAFAEITPAYHETVDGDHGRMETRRYWITSDIESLGAKTSWAKLQSIGMVESCREVGEKVPSEAQYFLPSLPAQGVRCSPAVRQHWGIEHTLHWVLEVSLNEEACRIRKDKGAQTFSVLRHIAVNLLRHERRHKWGIKARRKRAGWNQDYLLQVLAG
jgi:predicted transposase YbfD/YdcC